MILSSSPLTRHSSLTRGFTLVELLVSLVLAGIVAGLGLRFFLQQHWTGIAQSETAALQSALRGGMLFLTTELRELGGSPGDPDILVFAPESLTYRAMRGAGLSCSHSPSGVVVASRSFAGYRGAQVGRDSILLHLERGINTESDDQWLHLPLLGVAGSTCGSSPALHFATVLDTVQFPSGDFAPLAPARTFEIMQIRLYQSAGEYWLGARSVSAGETIQPLVGPLTIHGLNLDFRDSTGGPAVTAEDIRSIGITLRATSSGLIRTGGFAAAAAARRIDSLTTHVALRNW
jgi:prepilin-type N-terminal cleavage/methylation domain-containing protein